MKSWISFIKMRRYWACRCKREKAFTSSTNKGLFHAWYAGHEIRDSTQFNCGFSNIFMQSNLAFKDKEHAKGISKGCKDHLLLLIKRDVACVLKVESGKLCFLKKKVFLC